jgi:hypothetical protein
MYHINSFHTPSTIHLPKFDKHLSRRICTETKNIFMPHQVNAWQNHDIKTTNKSFEIVTKLRFVGITLKNKNHIPKNIRAD